MIRHPLSFALWMTVTACTLGPAEPLGPLPATPDTGVDTEGTDTDTGPPDVVDEPAGLALFLIENGTDRTLQVEHTAGAIAIPEVITTTIAPDTVALAFRSSGCLGCYDRPEDVLATLTLTDASTGEIVAAFDPVEDLQWNEERDHELLADWRLVLAMPAD